MILSLIAVAAIQIPAAAPEPIVTPYSMVGKTITVVGSTKLGQVRFTLNSVFPHSEGKAALSKNPLEVSIGGKSLGLVKFVKGSFATTDASLGLDVLSNTAVGIDLDRKELSIWPTGGLNPVVAKRWVAKVQPWAGLGAPEGVTYRYTPGPGGVPILRLKNGNLFAHLFLLLGFDATVAGILPQSLSDDPTPVHFASNIQIDTERLPWLELCNAWHGVNPFLASNVDGTFTLENFWSRRVLVDFKAHRIFAERLPETGRLTLLLSRLTRLPLMVTLSGLDFGGPNANNDPTWRDGIGLPLDDLAGIPGPTIYGMITHKSDKSGKSFAGLLKLLRGAYSAHFRLPNGNTIELNAPG